MSNELCDKITYDRNVCPVILITRLKKNAIHHHVFEIFCEMLSNAIEIVTYRLKALHISHKPDKENI